MAKLTSKGQVTIPKRVRDYLGLKPGSTVQFEVKGDGQVLLKGAEAQRAAETQKERLKKALAALPGTDKFSMTTDELMRLTRGWGEPDYDNPAKR
jgi:AbrB family looped-hinge helix DNA binding protein